MIVYLDTSALVKSLVGETGADLVHDVWDAASARATSRVTYPEARAALAAAARSGRMPPARLSAAKRVLDLRWVDLDVVELTDRLARGAGDMAEVFGLRGYDAVHLASALAVAEPEVVLATWDRPLAEAGLKAGLRIAPAL